MGRHDKIKERVRVAVSVQKAKAGPPRGGQYHWDEWFAMSEFTLQRGVDYFCSQSSIVLLARVMATHKKVFVSIVDFDVGIKVKVYSKSRTERRKEREVEAKAMEAKAKEKISA